MKITILGGGLTGLTAAWELSRKGHSVTLLEKEKHPGGLAGGFKEKGWDWYLERAYHHIFANDKDIIDFAREAGFGGIFLKSPKTVSLYKDRENNYRTFPVDTPQDFLKLPILSLPEKLRAGAVLAFLKISPFLSVYEKMSAEDFLRKTQGDHVWEVLWQELFRKKFGKNAGNIIASFIWARINKRTKMLGYFKGGFQEFINHLVEANTRQGVSIHTQKTVTKIKKGKGGLEVLLEGGERIFSDAVISTLPTPVFVKIAGAAAPENYIRKLSKIKYLHAVNLILETDKPIVKDAYWLNVCDPEAPMMVLVQHTNFVDRSNYQNKHILYVANYVEKDDPLIKASPAQVLNHYMPYIRKLSSNKKMVVSRSHVFKAPFAQPLFDKEYPANMPRMQTPVKGLYVANLDMTYPYDRGTNYAVKLGREAARLINKT